MLLSTIAIEMDEKAIKIGNILHAESLLLMPLKIEFFSFFTTLFFEKKQEFMLKGVKCLHDVLTFLMAK